MVSLLADFCAVDAGFACGGSSSGFEGLETIAVGATGGARSGSGGLALGAFEEAFFCTFDGAVKAGALNAGRFFSSIGGAGFAGDVWASVFSLASCIVHTNAPK